MCGKPHLIFNLRVCGAKVFAQGLSCAAYHLAMHFETLLGRQAEVLGGRSKSKGFMPQWHNGKKHTHTLQTLSGNRRAGLGLSECKSTSLFLFSNLGLTKQRIKRKLPKISSNTSRSLNKFNISSLPLNFQGVSAHFTHWFFNAAVCPLKSAVHILSQTGMDEQSQWKGFLPSWIMLELELLSLATKHVLTPTQIE